MTKSNQPQLSVYYDGLCILCSKEMDFYRKKDSQGKINFVDISQPEFDPKAEGLHGRDFNKFFHGKAPSGKVLVGVEAFQEIWKTLGIFSSLSYLASARATAPLFQLGYYAFIQIRPYLPRKKCETGHCRV